MQRLRRSNENITPLAAGADQPETAIFAGENISVATMPRLFERPGKKTQASHYTQLALEHQGRISML